MSRAVSLLKPADPVRSSPGGAQIEVTDENKDSPLDRRRFGDVASVVASVTAHFPRWRSLASSVRDPETWFCLLGDVFDLFLPHI